jgi:hypothetical protein
MTRFLSQLRRQDSVDLGIDTNNPRSYHFGSLRNQYRSTSKRSDSNNS